MDDLTGYRFTKTHEWVQMRGDLAYVGITDHAQEEITDLVSVEFPDVGWSAIAGDELLLVDSVKSTFSIYAPVPGTVAKVNEAIASNPGIVNTSPYEDGWMVALEGPSESDLQSLMTEEEYLAFLESEE